MKNINILLRSVLLLTLISSSAFAQISSVPQSFSHRGTAYTSNGTIISSGLIKIKVSILDYTLQSGPENGTTIYEEVFSDIQTNNIGQYSINIGKGTPLSPFNLNSFANINWGNPDTNILKYLKISIDPNNSQVGNYTVFGGNQLQSVPYALFSLASESTNTSNKTVNILDDLRSLNADLNEIVYVKGHTLYGDGGEGNFILKEHPQMNGDPRFDDNDGTIVISNLSPNYRWIRLIDGKINIKYFGVSGFNPSDGLKIQKAIDFAAKNASPSVFDPINPPSNYLYFNAISNCGTEVFIPAGNYLISESLIIRNGVSISGEGTHSTILTSNNNQLNGSMFVLDKGRVQGVNLSNFTLSGNTNPNESTIINGMYLKSKIGTTGDGGLWGATFKNIQISRFNGCGIILEGSGPADNYLIPNQNLVFENVYISRQTISSNCLLIRGQNGQINFNACGFDGCLEIGPAYSCQLETDAGFNVALESLGHVQPAAIKFNTCTFQYSSYGAFIQFAENVTFENCWFEALDRAIGVIRSQNTIPKLPSKSINVYGCRFANASGYGSIELKSKPKYGGACIFVDGGQVNAENNYVTVSDEKSIKLDDDYFLVNYDLSSEISVKNNSCKIDEFGKPVLKLTRTFGVTNNKIFSINGLIETSNFKFVLVESRKETISEIISTLNAGEILTIKAEGGSISFDNMKNINFSKTTTNGLNSFVLEQNETATFIKLDNPRSVTLPNSTVVTYHETYELIGFNKTY